MKSPWTIAPEMIDCIAHGRGPLPEEVRRMARRIRAEIGEGRSAFAWGGQAADGSAALLTLRAAEVALNGTSGADQRRQPVSRRPPD